jgi:hypothetical protein
MPLQTTQPKGLSGLSKFVRYRTAGYFNGRGIIFGADGEIFPHNATAPKVFALYTDPQPHPRVDVCDIDMEVCKDGAFDYVFVGRRFLEIPSRLPEEILQEAAKKLKVGGHLVVLFPLNSTNTVFKVEDPTNITRTIGSFGGWQAKDFYEREGHWLQIYKKLTGPRGVKPAKPRGARRACIVRYGAMGDMIMLTPLIHALADDGYEVTLNITNYSSAVVNHNPYISNIIYQERNAIPNQDLGEYWNTWKPEYDRYVNLSESIEGTLLKVEGRRSYFTRQQWRHETCNRNYYDYTMQLGGYPDRIGCRGEIYLSRDEERTAKKFRERFRDKFFILWALNGSSHHKVYGLFKPVVSDWLEAHPDSVVATVGDARAKEWEFEHPRLVKLCCEWKSIRPSLALAKAADVVVGPESVMTNAAGAFGTPVVTLLSHSSHENLCKYFLNDYCLTPNVEIAPCYGSSGCHQLHYSLESCPLTHVVDENKNIIASGPVCAMGAIEGERLIARLEEVYDKHYLATKSVII